MRKKFIYAAVLTVGVGLLTLTIAVYAVDNKQKVKSDQMTGYQETPGVSSTGTGSFTAEIDEDVVLDLGADGRPVAYEIQFASARHELVGRLMLEALKQADSGTTHTTHMIPPPLAGEVKEGDGAVRSVAG